MVDIKEVDAREILFADNSSFLFEEYANESGNRIIKEEVKTNNEKYIQLNDAGYLYCVGSFYDGVLVGFIKFIINETLHYSELSTTIDSQFVLKEYRRHGLWDKMLKMVIDISREKGSKNLIMTAVPNSKLDKVLKKRKYTLTDNVYTRSLS